MDVDKPAGVERVNFIYFISCLVFAVNVVILNSRSFLLYSMACSSCTCNM